MVSSHVGLPPNGLPTLLGSSVIHWAVVIKPGTPRSGSILGGEADLSRSMGRFAGRRATTNPGDVWTPAVAHGMTVPGLPRRMVRIVPGAVEPLGQVVYYYGGIQ